MRHMMALTHVMLAILSLTGARPFGPWLSAALAVRGALGRRSNRMLFSSSDMRPESLFVCLRP